MPTFYGRTHFFLPKESLSARFRRSSRFLPTPPRRGGALTGGIPRFRVPGPLQTASSTSTVWSSKQLFLQHWAPLLQGRQVIFATDNSTVVSYINKQGGTRSPTLLCLTVDLFLWLESKNIIVRARHIPGCLNVIADHLSRPNQPISTEWSLHSKIVERIFRVWGTPEVDMFATLSNSHLPRFMSPVQEPRALAVDALSQDWQGRSMYMFPPFPLLSKVMQKLRTTQVAEVILVAPWWQSQPWFPHLLRLCAERPLVLPYRRDLLSQQDQKYISDGKSYHLHVWRLSCDTIKQQAYQTRSLARGSP